MLRKVVVAHAASSLPSLASSLFGGSSFLWAELLCVLVLLWFGVSLLGWRRFLVPPVGWCFSLFLLLRSVAVPRVVPSSAAWPPPPSGGTAFTFVLWVVLLSPPPFCVGAAFLCGALLGVVLPFLFGDLRFLQNLTN